MKKRQKNLAVYLLTEENIKQAILAYHKEIGEAPTHRSGDASQWFGFPISWAEVDTALKEGT